MITTPRITSSAIAQFSNQLYDLGGEVSKTICESTMYQETARLAAVIRNIIVKQLSGISGIGLQIKTANIACKFYQLASVVDIGAKAIFAGIKESSTFAGAFGALAISWDVSQKIDQKVGEFSDHLYSNSPVDATGAILTAVGQTTYLFSRIMIMLNFVQDQLHISGLGGVISALSLPNQIAFLVGGLTQAFVFGARLVTGGAFFELEGDSKLCATANLVMDVLKFFEGLSWMVEASVMLIGCINPWLPLVALAISTGFKLAQVYVVPFVQEYTAPTPPNEKTVKELLKKTGVVAALLARPGTARVLIGANIQVDQQIVEKAVAEPGMVTALLKNPSAFEMLSNAVPC